MRQVLSHTGGFDREPPGFNPVINQPDFDLIRNPFAVPLP
jgi:hypothetical protein